MSECAWQFLFLVTVCHMTKHQIMQFIKQNLNLKAHPFLHNLVYDLVPKGVQEKRTEVLENKVDRM